MTSTDARETNSEDSAEEQWSFEDYRTFAEETDSKVVNTSFLAYQKAKKSHDDAVSAGTKRTAAINSLKVKMNEKEHELKKRLQAEMKKKGHKLQEAVKSEKIPNAVTPNPPKRQRNGTLKSDIEESSSSKSSKSKSDSEDASASGASEEKGTPEEAGDSGTSKSDSAKATANIKQMLADDNEGYRQSQDAENERLAVRLGECFEDKLYMTDVFKRAIINTMTSVFRTLSKYSYLANAVMKTNIAEEGVTNLLAASAFPPVLQTLLYQADTTQRRFLLLSAEVTADSYHIRQRFEEHGLEREWGSFIETLEQKFLQYTTVEGNKKEPQYNKIPKYTTLLRYTQVFARLVRWYNKQFGYSSFHFGTSYTKYLEAMTQFFDNVLSGENLKSVVNAAQGADEKLNRFLMSKRGQRLKNGSVKEFFCDVADFDHDTEEPYKETISKMWTELAATDFAYKSITIHQNEESKPSGSFFSDFLIELCESHLLLPSVAEDPTAEVTTSVAGTVTISFTMHNVSMVMKHLSTLTPHYTVQFAIDSDPRPLIILQRYKTYTQTANKRGNVSKVTVDNMWDPELNEDFLDGQEYHEIVAIFVRFWLQVHELKENKCELCFGKPMLEVAKDLGDLEISKRLHQPPQTYFGCPFWNDTSFPGFPSFPCVGKTHFEIFGGLIPKHRKDVFVNQDLDPYLHNLYLKLDASPCVSEARLCNHVGGNLGQGKARYKRVFAKGWRDFCLEDFRAFVRPSVPKGTLEDILLDVIVPSYRVKLHYLQSICYLRVPERIHTNFIIIVDNQKELLRTARTIEESLQYSVPHAIVTLEQHLSKTGNKVRVRCNQENLGASGSRNRGLDESCAEYVLNLDDDLTPEPDLLEEYGKQLLEYMDDDTVVGLVGLVRFPRSPHMPLRHAAVLMSYLTFMFEIAERTLYSNPAWGVTANIVFRRVKGIRFDLAYAKTGGGEDVDYALRITNACGGGRLVAVPSAKVVHPFWPGSVVTLLSHFRNWAIGDGSLFSRFPEYCYWSFPNLPETLVFAAIPFCALIGMQEFICFCLTCFAADVLVDGCSGDWHHRIQVVQGIGSDKTTVSRSFWFYLFAHILANLYVFGLECGRLKGHIRRLECHHGLFRRFDWHIGRLANASRNFRRREAQKFVLFVSIAVWFGVQAIHETNSGISQYAAWVTFLQH